MCVYVYVCMCVCVCVSAYMCVCVYVCMSAPLWFKPLTTVLNPGCHHTAVPRDWYGVGRLGHNLVGARVCQRGYTFLCCFYECQRSPRGGGAGMAFEETGEEKL